MFTVTSKKSGKTYILHEKAGKTPFHFFAGAVSTNPGVKVLDALPPGKEVFENDRTGLPMLRGKRVE